MWFLPKFIISVRAGHCDSSLRAPKYLATPMDPGPNLIEIFSVFSEIKCKYVDKLAKRNPSPLYISIVHFAQAAHLPYYYRRYSPSTVKSTGNDAVVFAWEHISNRNRSLGQKYRYNMNFARKYQQCTLHVFGYKLTWPVWRLIQRRQE